MPSSKPKLKSCWAKTNAETGLPALTVRDHCLHVGAVAKTIIQILPKLIYQDTPKGAATLAALHDIGKITLGFQKKCPHWKHFSDIPNIGLEGNHAKVSQAFYGDFIKDRNPAYWSISLGGHHGRYNSDKPRIRGFKEQEQEWAQNLRLELAKELIELFGDLPDTLEKPTPYQLHWFTGFITFADWIGSNEDFFPLPSDNTLKNHATLQGSEAMAEAALTKIQWSEVQATPHKKFSDIFPFKPNPLQKALATACDSQGLYIVEATMGMGKTEAALYAAYQRWQTGDERGIYFALPTQLTSNRIFKRISPFLENSTTSSSMLSLVHGSSWLSENRTMQIHASNSNDSNSLFVNDALKWFSSSRRAILAPFGVGTIDQALLSVLHTKYASLRFFGLAGKTVVLDEVHSYDEFTFELICKLVKELTLAGSSVIILSATLTQKARRKLIESAGGKEATDQSAYPLITAIKRTKDTITTSHHPVPLAKNEEKSKKFHLHHIYLPEACDQDSATLQSAVDAAEKGACVLIIRNTVKTAQTTYAKLKSLTPEHIPVGLLHSRFPYQRRQEIEKKWVGKLEKESSTRPDGCILIATQVVEQSVDIDADLLITDLAPTDLILQRLGRVHRHPRNRPAGFELPQCWILHPTTTETSDPQTLKKQLGASAWVYPPYTLLRSSDVWSQKNAVTLPDDIRPLLESSIVKQPQTTPAIQGLLESQEADIQKKINTSRTSTHTPIHTLALSDDDQGNQTRWGNQQSATLVLLTRPPIITGNTLTLEFLTGETYSAETYNYAFDFKLAKLLHLNAVRIPAYLLPKDPSASSWINDYFFGACTIAIPEHGTGGHCDLPDISSEHNYAISYNQDSGISFEQISPSSQPYEDDEECWW